MPTADVAFSICGGFAAVFGFDLAGRLVVPDRREDDRATQATELR